MLEVPALRPEALELLLEELALIAGRKSCHGTATCFPPKAGVLESPEALADGLEGEPVLDEVPALGPPTALAPPVAPEELFSEIIANSILPAMGFTI